MMICVTDKLENIVGKGEIAGYQKQKVSAHVSLRGLCRLTSVDTCSRMY